MVFPSTYPENSVRDSAPDWTFAQLVKRIVTGEIPAGARLTEEQLAADLGVSRTPLRAALQRLESARIVTKNRNRSIYVTPLRFEEIVELTAIRERVEGAVAFMAAERVLRGAATTDRARFIAERLDAQSFTDAVGVFTLGESFHVELAHVSGSARSAAILHDLYLGLERYRYRLAEDPARAPQRFAEHMEILEAIEAGEPERAETLMRRHIRHALEIYRQRLPSEILAASGGM